MWQALLGQSMGNMSLHLTTLTIVIILREGGLQNNTDME